MPYIETPDVNEALRLSAEADACTQSELNKFNKGDNAVSSDYENESERSIFDTFYTDGEAVFILSMTNLKSDKFGNLWNLISDDSNEVHIVGRARKSSVSSKDAVPYH